MTRSLRIGMDLDGVVADYHGRVMALRESTYTPSDCTEWDSMVELTGFDSSSEMFEWIEREHPCLFLDLPPRPGALEALNRLTEAGHRLVIITSRPESKAVQTKLWLHKMDIDYHALWVTSDKASVPPCDIYLDDASHNLKSLVAAHPDAVVMRWPRPWNRHVSGAFTAADWSDFCAVVRRLAVLPSQSAEDPKPTGSADSGTGEIRVTNESTGGEKGQKTARFDLIPAGPLTDVALHYGIGARKYEDRNWERGYDWSLSFGALQRHLWAFWAGEDLDPDADAPTPHLAAVVFHALALMEFAETHPELDDRPQKPETAWDRYMYASLAAQPQDER